MKVLVVDDEPRIAKSLERLLQAHGHEATIAHDGLEAWELFEQSPSAWGVLITDIRMPRLDGINLTRRIRAHGSTIHVVLISGHGEAPDVNALSPAVFLAKPFRRAELLAAMFITPT
jgi:DNA-binding response OmpR family regulator